MDDAICIKYAMRVSTSEGIAEGGIRTSTGHQRSRDSKYFSFVSLHQYKLSRGELNYSVMKCLIKGLMPATSPNTWARRTGCNIDCKRDRREATEALLV
eukprot:1190626-Prorocentrum_minimum.AAC.4